MNDDCSTDGTADIIREYAAKYPDIIRPFYQKENLYSQGGMVFLFSKVFYPSARGEYIAYCEGDDCWTDPEKLQRQADFLDAHPGYSGCVHNTLLHYCDASAPDGPLLPAGQGDRDVDFTPSSPARRTPSTPAPSSRGASMSSTRPISTIPPPTTASRITPSACGCR